MRVIRGLRLPLTPLPVMSERTMRPARRPRAAGQAVATAHVFTHAPGAAIYALQAIHRATDADDTEAAIARERDWQYQRLVVLSNADDQS